MKAIVMSYVCDQNAPSKPSSVLLDVPKSEEELIAVLKDLVKTHFGDEADDEWYEGWELSYNMGYGDVSYGNACGDCFIFLTYVTE